MSKGPSRGSLHPSIEVEWLGGSEFEAGRAAGPTLRIDGDAKRAPSPFDVMLASLATCASVDIVTILHKQRTPAKSLHVRVEAQRVETTPRRLPSAILHFGINAPGTTPQKVARAVELSVTKYCSVLVPHRRRTGHLDDRAQALDLRTPGPTPEARAAVDLPVAAELGCNQGRGEGCRVISDASC